MPNQTALALPDALLVRYFRAAEIDDITEVKPLEDGRLRVELRVAGIERTDHWRNLGGGLGFVPDGE
jgi:hypothetical protein